LLILQLPLLLVGQVLPFLVKRLTGLVRVLQHVLGLQDAIAEDHGPDRPADDQNRQDRAEGPGADEEIAWGDHRLLGRPARVLDAQVGQELQVRLVLVVVVVPLLFLYFGLLDDGVGFGAVIVVIVVGRLLLGGGGRLLFGGGGRRRLLLRRGGCGRFLARRGRFRTGGGLILPRAGFEDRAALGTLDLLAFHHRLGRPQDSTALGASQLGNRHDTSPQYAGEPS